MTRPLRTGNVLLDRLPWTEYERLAPQLHEVPVSFKERLYDRGKRISHVYFPTSGVASVIVPLDEDDFIEIATIGREGMVGLPLFLGVEHPGDCVFCQVPGAALRMDARRFVEATQQSPPLRDVLRRYAYTLMAAAAQTAVCNRIHNIDSRMARWLLASHDRIDGDEFPITQQFLSQMLGVRRPAVSVAGATLQRAGLIRYRRGRIAIVDRAGLERASCECYERIRDEYARAFSDQQGHARIGASPGARRAR